MSPGAWRGGIYIDQIIKNLISEFYNDLTLNHPMIGFKYTREELIEKYKKKLEEAKE